MTIGLICPSNMLYMPYVKNYELILKENNVNYEIINWDRFHIEDPYSPLIYRDKKIGHKRRFWDYYKYKKFLIELLNQKQYQKLIIFGIQLSFFLKKYLLKKFEGKYVIDIRDYNKVLNFFNIKDIIDNSNFTVISSHGYKQWLPISDKYVINHNINNEDINKFVENEAENNTLKINISYIGSITNYDINIKLINEFKTSSNFILTFHGEGTINNKLIKYINKHKITNVNISGRYEKIEEKELYLDCNLVNLLLNVNDINSKTCLANRLYKAALFGKPVVTFNGTYISEITEKYNLGIVLDSFEETEANLYKYLRTFDKDKYNKGRKEFLKWVMKENELFRNKIEGFVGLS